MNAAKVFAPLAIILGSTTLAALATPSFAESVEPDSPIEVVQYWDTCGQMGWEDVDSFETDDFFVSICQEDGVLHLVGEAKDLSGFVDLPVFETRDRRYAVRDGEDYLAIDNELLIGLQEIQSDTDAE